MEAKTRTKSRTIDKTFKRGTYLPGFDPRFTFVCYGVKKGEFRVARTSFQEVLTKFKQRFPHVSDDTPPKLLLAELDVVRRTSGLLIIVDGPNEWRFQTGYLTNPR